MLDLDRDRKTVSVGSSQARQTETVIAGVVIGAVLLVGFLVLSSLFTAVPSTRSTTVTNQTITQDVGNWTELNPPNADPSHVESVDDDEVVWNSTDVQLTEDTDYEWNTSDGTIKFLSTASTSDGADANVTYTYNQKPDGIYATLDRIGDALLIGGVLIIVLFAAVVLRVLRGL